MGEKFNVGDQVIVLSNPDGGEDLRGEVAFVGELEFTSGTWFGIILAEAKGKNNGTLQLKKYFECPANHGLFVRQPRLCPANSPLGERCGATTPSKLSGVKSKIPRLTKMATRILAASDVEQSSSTESLVARSSRSESSEAAVSKIDETDGQGLAFSSNTTTLQILSEENRKLKRDVEDLASQLEVLKECRQADMEKLKDLEKLQEFKQKMLEQYSQLKMEMQIAQGQAKSKLKAVEANMEDDPNLLEFRDYLEMVVMDKEIAEENAEQLAVDLQEARDEVKELRTELEMKIDEELQGLEEAMSPSADA